MVVIGEKNHFFIEGKPLNTCIGHQCGSEVVLPEEFVVPDGMGMAWKVLKLRS